MITSKGVNCIAKNTQTEWDLTSSLTGTVKRRPTSLESCKSNSPTKTDNDIIDPLDFPTDTKAIDNNTNATDIGGTSCKINKPGKSFEEDCTQKYDLSQEIAAQGNSQKENKIDETQVENGEKINNQAKRRFFDLKIAESTKKSFSFTSKLKLPNRVSLNLSPRKSLAHNKLSLSQLEQQNNLFIRDGQQQQQHNSSDSNKSVDAKINKQEHSTKTKNNIIFVERKQKQNEPLAAVVMERGAESNNLKQKQQQESEHENLSTSKLEMSKNKKSSLIPSFLSGGGSAKNPNHIKIQSTSATTARKSLSTKLTKTGNKFKELCRDFPSTAQPSSNKAQKGETKVPLKRNPPPYRPPPAPQNKHAERQKKIRFSENTARNYEEIDMMITEEGSARQPSKTNAQDFIEVNLNNETSNTFNTKAIVHLENTEKFEGDQKPEDDNNDNEEIDKILAKAEYSSNVFKNIPVRPRKNIVPHMENYCLFDPTVDFCNEKELMKKKLVQPRIPELNSGNVRATSTLKPSRLRSNVECVEESIEDVIFEDETVYDVSEHDERTNSLAHHNYYEIDPELLEADEINACAIETGLNRIAVENESQSSGIGKSKKSKIYSNALSTSSSESTSTSQTSSNSSSSSSSDYPSLFNSVIETTHSSTIESTDDNDSNGYGKVKNASTNGHNRSLSSQNGDMINQINVTATSNESIITISNVVTCGEVQTGTTKKKSPQLNRIIRQTSLAKTQRIVANEQLKSNKINSPLSQQNFQLDPLKSSHSLPQLQNISVQNRCRQVQNNQFNFVIDNTTTILLRRQHNSRSVRPLSTHSDDRDSGFLSPVTPTSDSQNMTHNNSTPANVICEQNSLKTESTLNQCDNIQQLIEVSRSYTEIYDMCDG